jgi:hypothetical protein
MKINYNVTGSDRKQLVSIITRETGIKAAYQGMPSMAYAIGDITVEKDGTMVWDERTDNATIQRITEALAAAGFEGIREEPEAPASAETEAPAEPDTATEPVELTVGIPTSKHTGASLRNLINLLYTRASLLNKALGTSFRVDEALTEALQDDACILTTDSLLRAIGDFEAEHGKAIDGLTITPEEITFGSLPETTDTEKLHTFTILCGMMSKQAIDQKRIQAKGVNEDNEKYALRIWLTRLGMNGPEFKTTRRVLMENLTGHSAFRTDVEKQRWMQRQAEKREALKAAKAAEATEEVETA